MELEKLPTARGRRRLRRAGRRTRVNANRYEAAAKRPIAARPGASRTRPGRAAEVRCPGGRRAASTQRRGADVASPVLFTLGRSRGRDVHLLPRVLHHAARRSRRGRPLPPGGYDLPSEAIAVTESDCACLPRAPRRTCARTRMYGVARHRAHGNVRQVCVGAARRRRRSSLAPVGGGRQLKSRHRRRRGRFDRLQRNAGSALNDEHQGESTGWGEIQAAASPLTASRSTSSATRSLDGRPDARVRGRKGPAARRSSATARTAVLRKACSRGTKRSACASLGPPSRRS